MALKYPAVTLRSLSAGEPLVTLTAAEVSAVEVRPGNRCVVFNGTRAWTVLHEAAEVWAAVSNARENGVNVTLT